MKKIFSKRKITLFLAIVTIFTFLLTGCGPLTGAAGYTLKSFKGTRTLTLSSKRLDMFIATKMTCDFRYCFYDGIDFSKENGALKQFCFISLMDAHSIGLASFDVAPNTDETDNTKFLTEMGFVNVEEYVVGSDATTDVDDKVTMVISHKYCGTSNGKMQFILNVSLCGTQDSSEWKSNFDFGSDTSDYTGEHPDWTDKNNHKGFDVTANRVIRYINTYIAKNNALYLGQTVVAISGYSHGAAVANLVGAKIADDSKKIMATNYKPAVYTFATPRTTLATNNTDAKYGFIHNYINEDDVVPNLPTEAMGYKRFGQDHIFAIENNATNKTKFNNQVDIIKAEDAKNGITSKLSYYNASCANTVITNLNKLLSNRNDVYTVIEDNAHKTYSLGDKKEYATEEAARQAGELFLAEMALSGYGKYFKDAGVVARTEKTFIGYGLDEQPEYDTTNYYIWYCYVGDGVLVEVFNTVVSNALQGKLENVFSNKYLVDYSKHSSTFGTITTALIFNTSYFSNAHNPLAYYIGTLG